MPQYFQSQYLWLHLFDAANHPQAARKALGRMHVPRSANAIAALVSINHIIAHIAIIPPHANEL